ncbi:hypothetical protein F4813DRAFT_397780 [Daldinia decipiens]|uniref:uncharacterized protein n=1 Tax=Daldinia decipiens TaxID=326647 RepID=UPI0020C27E84|nr:uncharacterized protein F4813DRAFT_397780 [Daldinia decipiens]KAI1656105.1 hypothetical protein F4813DRAFT_397780 [Daldinia decipiens]
MNPRKRSYSSVGPLMDSAEGQHPRETSADAGPSSAKKTRPLAEYAQSLPEFKYVTAKSKPPGANDPLLPPKQLTERVRQVLKEVAPLVGVSQLSNNEFTDFINSLCSMRELSLPPLQSSSSHLKDKKADAPCRVWVTAITNACKPLPKPMIPLWKEDIKTEDGAFLALQSPVFELWRLIDGVSTAVLIMAGRKPTWNLKGWEAHKGKDGNCIAEGPFLQECRGLHLTEAIDLKDNLLKLYREADLDNHLRISLTECITSAKGTSKIDRMPALKALSRLCVPITKYAIFSMTHLHILGDKINRNPIYSSKQVLELYFSYLLLQELIRDEELAPLDSQSPPSTILYNPSPGIRLCTIPKLSKEAETYVHETFQDDILKAVGN